MSSELDRSSLSSGDEPSGTNKKRKVPAFPVSHGRDQPIDDDEDVSQPSPASRLTARYHDGSTLAKAHLIKKGRFLRRKAALITLYLDAQSAVLADAAKLGSRPLFPDVPTFERLLPALEDVGVNEWAPDLPAWRSGNEEEMTKVKRPERWRAAFERRRRAVVDRKPVARGGWAPESSFEFENESNASVLLRGRARDRAALQRLIVELRSIVLASKPASQVVATSSEPSLTPVTAASSQGSEAVAGKKKTKKKKSSVLANQSNPHHVDNYRPSRTVSYQGDPFEPYPHHTSQLFPPPMHFLAARSRPNLVRAAEDDYICCFCEYDLFFGSEAARKRAIRRRRRELKKRRDVKARARNIAEGKVDEPLDDDEVCEGEDCHDRCSCGRPITSSHKSRSKEPPDPTFRKPFPAVT